MKLILPVCLTWETGIWTSADMAMKPGGSVVKLAAEQQDQQNQTRHRCSTAVGSTRSCHPHISDIAQVELYNNNNNNNTSICKAHNVSIRAESEAPAVARWRGWL